MKRKRWVILVAIFIGLGCLTLLPKNRLLWSRNYTGSVSLTRIAGECWVLDQQRGTIEVIQSDGPPRTLDAAPAGSAFVAPAGSSGAFLIVGKLNRGGPLVTTSVHHLDANGREQRRYATLGIATPPALAEDGSIVFVNNEGLLQALHPDGRLRLSKLVGGTAAGAPRIKHNSFVLFEHTWNRLSRLTLDGDVVWSTILEGNSGGGLGVFDAQTNVIWAAGRTLTKWDWSGTPQWTNQQPTRPKPEPTGTNRPASLSDSIYHISIDAQDRIYTKTADGWLHMFEPDGRHGWSRQMAGHASKMVFTPQGNLVIACEDVVNYRPGTPGVFGESRDARVICLSPHGEQLWEVKLPGDFEWKLPKSRLAWKQVGRQLLGYHRQRHLSTPVVAADGTVYVSTFSDRPAGFQTIIHAIRGDPTAE